MNYSHHDITSLDLSSNGVPVRDNSNEKSFSPRHIVLINKEKEDISNIPMLEKIKLSNFLKFRNSV